MSYIELLDEQIVNFYRSHNYWWPDEIVMSQNTMDKLKQEMRSKGFYDWKGNKFNYVSLKISPISQSSILWKHHLTLCFCKFVFIRFNI